MATILLLEPHPLLRLGLRHLLAQAHVPGDLIDLDPAGLNDPDPWTHHADLLLFGLPADAEAGWQTLADLCRRLSPLRVLVLADHLPAPLPEAGLPEAVRGLLAKTCSADALEAAIRLVLAGGECFPSQLPPTRAAEPSLPDARHDAAPIVVPLHAVPALPGGATAGDTYLLTDAGHLHTWDGAAWQDAGPVGVPGPTSVSSGSWPGTLLV